MTTSSPQPGPQNLPSSPLAWIVRVAAILSIIPVWLKFGEAVCDPCDGYPPTWFFASMAWTPLLILILARTGLAGSPKKAGLAWAVIAGVFFLPVSVYMTVTARNSGDNAAALIWLLGILLMAALGASAAIAYRAVGWKQEDKALWLQKLGRFVIYLIIAGIVASMAEEPGQGGVSSRMNQSKVITTMRNFIAAETQYASKHDHGFSPNLESLGSFPESSVLQTPPRGLALGLTSCPTSLGFAFNYIPAPPDANGHIAHYQFSARSCCPLGYSFLIDDSGVIRYTIQNRAATSQDPPLAG